MINVGERGCEGHGLVLNREGQATGVAHYRARSKVYLVGLVRQRMWLSSSMPWFIGPERVRLRL